MGKEVRFEAEDSRGRRTFVVPADEPAWSGNPVPIVRDIEAHTRTRLRDGGNPNWFIRLYRHFKDRADPAAGVSFAEFIQARGHTDRVEVGVVAAPRAENLAGASTAQGPIDAAEVTMKDFGTRPGEWTSELKKDLGELNSIVGLSGGDLGEHDTPRFVEILTELHKRQLVLRALDLSCVDPPVGHR